LLSDDGYLGTEVFRPVHGTGEGTTIRFRDRQLHVEDGARLNEFIFPYPSTNDLFGVAFGVPNNTDGTQPQNEEISLQHDFGCLVVKILHLC